MKYFIYTDGACSGNPGPGGYAFVVNANNRSILKVSGCKPHTTNNEMELMAIVQSLKHILANHKNLKGSLLTIRSDSAYCVNAITQGWPFAWRANNWMTSQNTEVKNKSLWEDYCLTVESLKKKSIQVKAEKVKGHSGDEFNEMVDQAARKAILRIKGEANVSIV